MIKAIKYSLKRVLPMNILHLKYAVEIANEGSLNKAAKNLYIGQPNLSRAIKELESDLGITIFTRSAKGMVTTSEGEQFLQYAKAILKQIDEVEAVYKSGAPIKQKLSVSAPRASYIAEAFAQLSKSIDMSSPAELFYKETNANRAIKNVLQSDYNLGIIRYAESYDRRFKEMLDEKGFIYETVAEFKYVLIMSKEHPLADKQVIKYSDLEPFIEIAHADPFVPSIPFSVVRKEELPDNINKRIFVFERASQFELLAENRETFMWVSPVPDIIRERYGLVQKKCDENQRVYKDVLIYRKDYRMTELDKQFITELVKSKKKYFK